MNRRTRDLGTCAPSRVEEKIAAAVAGAPPLPDDMAALLVRLIRTAPSTQEGSKP